MRNAIARGLTGVAIAIAAVLVMCARGSAPDALLNGIDVALLLVCGATWADALTPLGLLNFLVLQWFGVRLCKRQVRESVKIRRIDGSVLIDEEQLVTVGYGAIRWIWPLTGWWTDYRYIARRS